MECKCTPKIIDYINRHIRIKKSFGYYNSFENNLFTLNNSYIYFYLVLWIFFTGISTIKDPKTPTLVDIKLCVKSKFRFSMKVSSAHYLLFSTGNICILIYFLSKIISVLFLILEDLMYIKQSGKMRHLESKSFKVAVDQYNIFTVKGFKMLKTDFNKDVQTERQNSEGLTSETNTIW